MAHKDTIVLTVLWAPHPGVEARLNNNWQKISTLENYIGIQFGKAIRLMTDGHCHALEHRVIMDDNKERFSLASFMGPPADLPLQNYLTHNIIEQRYGDWVKKDIKKAYHTDEE